MLTQFQPNADPLDAAYALCLEHAMVENAFPPRLTRQWFDAAWALCAEHIGLVYPARRIDETLEVNQETGTIRLTYRPSSMVQLFAGVRPLGTFAPNGPCFTSGCADLCCHCWIRAIYTVGEDLGCAALPPRFVQAVMHLFAFIAENRGDTPIDESILSKSGAKVFLGPEITYVL